VFRTLGMALAIVGFVGVRLVTLAAEPTGPAASPFDLADPEFRQLEQLNWVSVPRNPSHQTRRVAWPLLWSHQVM
jgi:hypothetical protein